VADALRTVSYEVLPFRNTEESVLAYVPREVSLTVTATEAKGLDPTLQLAERLAQHGYRVAPHLAARLVRDRVHLTDVVARLKAAEVGTIFVIGGDAREPVGDFPDALSLLEAMQESGHHFSRIGIGGYPEGHGRIDTALIDQALADKAPHATHLITQLCFDADTITSWGRRIRQRGLQLPVLVGLPGPVNRQKLIRISAGLGLGQSARFLQKQHGMLRRFFTPGGYRPDRLIERLAPAVSADDNGIGGFHLFTFNELAGTEAWRREWLARLLASGRDGEASLPGQHRS
jgi:methylenetetrahydrofolate reductase (NADPH)